MQTAIIREERLRLRSNPGYTPKRFAKAKIYDQDLLDENIRKACKIINIVCFYHKLSDLIANYSRKRHIVKARQQAISLIYDYTDLDEREIGLIFGNMDHSSINHARKKVIEDFTSKSYLYEYEKIEEWVKGIKDEFGGNFVI
jgi:chromosomal replication initiation ATPase DnaA